MKTFSQLVHAVFAYSANLVAPRVGASPASPGAIAGAMAAASSRRKRTHVFGTEPPRTGDPGGTHAYMMRHRT